MTPVIEKELLARYPCLMAGTIRIGISGWRYKPWRENFYPKDLPQKNELRYAAEQVKTIEINGSFYSLQRPESYQHWYDETPDAFVFSVKGGRYITHILRLHEVETPLANFFASGVLALEEKLGPFLWQFPEREHFDPKRLSEQGVNKFEHFFKLLPRTTKDAAMLAKKHNQKTSGRVFLSPKNDLPLRHAVEIRHQSFLCEEFVEMLRRASIALVVADTAKRWPYAEEVTSDFLYLRLHGDKELYASGYTAQALSRWASRILSWASGSEPGDARRITTKSIRRRPRDVYVYFDNDAKVHAPFDAVALAEKIERGLKRAKAA